MKLKLPKSLTSRQEHALALSLAVAAATAQLYPHLELDNYELAGLGRYASEERRALFFLLSNACLYYLIFFCLVWLVNERYRAQEQREEEEKREQDPNRFLIDTITYDSMVDMLFICPAWSPDMMIHERPIIELAAQSKAYNVERLLALLISERKKMLALLHLFYVSAGLKCLPQTIFNKIAEYSFSTNELEAFLRLPATNTANSAVALLFFLTSFENLLQDSAQVRTPLLTYEQRLNMAITNVIKQQKQFLHKPPQALLNVFDKLYGKKEDMPVKPQPRKFTPGPAAP